MIRGISKKIIEVNDTGSDMFEKALFFVKSDCKFNEKRLQNEAKVIVDSYLTNKSNNIEIKEGFLRYTDRKKKVVKRAIIGFFVALSCISIFLIINRF